MVSSGLGAAEGMGEGVEPVNGAGDQILILPDQCLGHVIDAAYGGDDPDLVPDTHAAVRAAVALKGQGRSGRYGVHVGMIGIFHLAGQVRCHVVGVHPHAGENVRGGVTNGKAVLYHIFTGRDCRQGHFVALGNVLPCGHARKNRALGDSVEGDRHVVPGMNADKIGHGTPLTGRLRKQPWRPAPGSASGSSP